MRAGQPHVWRASLDLPAPRLAALHATLSVDERARAARFHFDRDRDHYIAARGLLRELLGRYLDREPGTLRFAYGPRGKPSLAGLDAATPCASGGPRGTPSLPNDDLRFNLSHSHGLALFAFARGAELGVDVEHVRLDFASDEIAERFFSPREVSALRALPAAQRAEGFFNCWTRKEAYIKASGDGLAIPLDSFDVTLAPGDPARLLEVRAEPAQSPSLNAGSPPLSTTSGPADEAARWSLFALSPAPAFAAALIVEGPTPPPTLFAVAEGGPHGH